MTTDPGLTLLFAAETQGRLAAEARHARLLTEARRARRTRLFPAALRGLIGRTR